MKKRDFLSVASMMLSILLLSASFISCVKKDEVATQKELKTHANAFACYNWANQVLLEKETAFNEYVENLSLEEKICQLFIENLEGNTEFKPVEKLNLISNNPNISEDKYIIPGGYLFFSFNVGNTPEQIMEFTSSIQKYCDFNNQMIPFLSIDQEGGYVNRLKKINGPLPSAEIVSKKASEEIAEELYGLQAKQMKCLGFNMNLAPVAEICTVDNQDFLTERSFGNESDVIKYGKACVKAYENNGIGAVLKHFPGNTNTDPHTGLPEIKLSVSELEKSLIPFVELIKENPAGILMSHARTSEIDGKIPACLSSIWVTDKLRNQYGYQGIIFSDDIFMGALASNGYKPEKAVVMAIEAGIDCIMISEKRILKPAQILYKKAVEEPEFGDKINQAVKRICVYKLNSGLLKYSRSADGKYFVESNFDYADINQRIDAFYEAKNKNQELYTKYYK